MSGGWVGGGSRAWKMVGVALAAVLLVLGVRGYRVLREPLPISPDPPLPSPNAFDDYVRAGRLLEASRRSISDALRALPRGPGEPPSRARRHASSEPPMPMAEVRRVARGPEGFDALLASAARKPYLCPVLLGAPGPKSPMEWGSWIGRMLSLRGRLAAAEGRWDAVSGHALQSLSIATRITRGDGVNGLRIAIPTRVGARRQLWRALDHLSAPQASDAARRMEGILSGRVPMAMMLEADRLRMQRYGAGLYTELSGFSAAGRWTGEEDNPGPDVSRLPYTARVALRGDLPALNRFYDRLALVTRHPFARRTAMPVCEPNILTILTSITLSDYNFWASEVGDHARSLLLQTALALRAYRLERGGYPDTLAQLCPRYLPRLVADPFGTGALLQYHRKGDGYQLYSVGPDGKDDGGRLMQAPKDAREGSVSGYPLEAGSKGDLISGLDTFQPSKERVYL